MKVLLFVDDEQKVLQGLQRQLRPMRHEWDMYFVESGPQALAFMATQPVDIIISDMMMPGMDGSQLLGEVLKRHPQTVRVILSGQTGHEAVLRLVGPAHQYLSKPCDPDELRRAITRALELRDLLGSGELKQLATRIKNLPTLPTLYRQLTEELRRDEPSVEHVGEIISHDIGMAAKVLQLVNSAFFGLARPVSNPTEAVTYLGLNTIRSLALSVGVFSQYDQDTCQLFSLDVLAEHSWVVGGVARRLAQMERQEMKVLEQCFLAGLLHDVGQLVLANGLPGEYAAVMAKDGRQRLPVWQVEQEFFGAAHADVGAYLLALWGLPHPIIEAVAHHHHPARCVTPGFSATIAAHAADVFTHEFLATRTEVPLPELDVACLTSLGFADRIAAWRADAKEAIESRNTD
jgi:HD-like signal output (HDOD) protein/CheY-like chemotaxis protein